MDSWFPGRGLGSFDDHYVGPSVYTGPQVVESQHTGQVHQPSRLLLWTSDTQLYHRWDHTVTAAAFIVEITGTQASKDCFNRHLLPWRLVSLEFQYERTTILLIMDRSVVVMSIVRLTTFVHLGGDTHRDVTCKPSSITTTLT